MADREPGRAADAELADAVRSIEALGEDAVPDTAEPDAGDADAQIQ